MYFKNFPTTIWNRKEMVDISRRADVLKMVSGDPLAFVPYIIQEGDTIETIAYNYYGEAELSWLVAIANDIIDPYADFFKGQEELDRYIANKYDEEATASLNPSFALSDTQIIDWTKNATITDNILYYYSKYNENIQVNKKTQLTPQLAADEFVPLRYYEYENNINEEKRTINLISDVYVDQIIDEMKTVLND